MYEDKYGYNYQDTFDSLERIKTGRYRLKDYELWTEMLWKIIMVSLA